MLIQGATCSAQTANQNTNVAVEVCKVVIKRTISLTVMQKSHCKKHIKTDFEMDIIIFVQRHSGVFLLMNSNCFAIFFCGIIAMSVQISICYKCECISYMFVICH